MQCQVQSLLVLVCSIGLGHSYPDVSGVHGVGVSHGVSHSSPLTLARGPALISGPQSQVLPSRVSGVSGVSGARPLATGPVSGVVRPVGPLSRPTVNNVISRPAQTGAVLGPALAPAFSSRPLGQTVLPSSVAGKVKISIF